MFPHIFWAVFVSEICINYYVDNVRIPFGGGPSAYPLFFISSLWVFRYMPRLSFSYLCPVG